jgi:hypothetical protein
MCLKAVQEAPSSSVVVRVDLEPGVNKGAYEPGPNRALVIGCVAGAQVAVVAGLIGGMVCGSGAFTGASCARKCNDGMTFNRKGEATASCVRTVLARQPPGSRDSGVSERQKRCQPHTRPDRS